jgi:hypothetical protein
MSGSRSAVVAGRQDTSDTNPVEPEDLEMVLRIMDHLKSDPLHAWNAERRWTLWRPRTFLPQPDVIGVFAKDKVLLPGFRESLLQNGLLNESSDFRHWKFRRGLSAGDDGDVR